MQLRRATGATGSEVAQRVGFIRRAEQFSAAPGWPLRSFSIDVLPVPDSLNLDDVRIAENFVDDAIISDADSVSALSAGEFL